VQLTRTRAGLFAGALCAVATAGVARAQGEEPVSIAWTAPDGCPSGGEVRAEALRLLAGPPIRPDRRVAANARVVHLATGRWRVDVSMSSATAEGKRSIEASTCSGLADATALIVAIMVDPDRAGAAAAAPKSTTPASPPPPASAPAPTAPTPPPPPPPAPAIAPADRPLPTPAKAEAPRWAMGSWFVVDSSILPSAAFGAAFGLAAMAWHLRADVAFTILPDRTYVVSSESGVGADMSLWAASGKLAYVVPVGPVELAMGGGAEITHISATGVALSAPLVAVSGGATWPSLRAGATLTTRIYKPIFLHIEGDAVAPLERPAFVIDPLGSVHRPSAVTARLGAGVEWRF
jgi:hypothetical protein